MTKPPNWRTVAMDKTIVREWDSNLRLLWI